MLCFRRCCCRRCCRCCCRCCRCCCRCCRCCCRRRRCAAGGGAFTAGGIIKVTWKLIIVQFCLSIYGTVDGDMFKPFLFSRIRCCDAASAYIGGEYSDAAIVASALDGSYNLTSAVAIDHYLGHGAAEEQGIT